MKQKEEWKPMKEFDEIYYISNYGQVKSYMVDKVDGRFIKPKITKKGYTSYLIKHKGKCISFYCHRKVAEYFVPNPNGYDSVDHIKNDKSLNYAWELQWMEHADNCRKDQAKTIICVSPLGKEIEAKGTRHAAQIASCTRRTVQWFLKSGGSTRHEWQFKYKKK